MKNTFFLLFLLLAIVGVSQTDSIRIHMKYAGNSSVIEVQQDFVVEPNGKDQDFYLYAWANAYKNKHTTLAKTKLNSRKDALYFAPLQERGWIENLHFTTPEGKRIPFSEADEELIKLIIPEKAEKIKFSASYQIHLPHKKITGYGIDGGGNLLLKYFFLQPAIRDYNGIVRQNYKDFESLSSNNNFYELLVDVPENYVVYTDLEEKDQRHFSGNKMDFFQVSVQEPGNSFYIQTAFGKVIYGFKPKESDLMQLYPIVNREMAFLDAHLGKLDAPLFISEKNYKKNKFDGVQDVDIPIFGKYKMFETQDRLNLEMLPQLISAYVDRKVLVNKRNDHWILNGIKAYLQLKYIQKYYPKLLLAGKIPDDIRVLGMHPLKIFDASKVKMQERTELFYRIFFLSNLDQPINTPFDSLSNNNQKIISAYKTALGFEYMAAYLGENAFDDILKSLIQNYEGKRLTADAFSNYFIQNADKNVCWFFDDFITSDKNMDFGITSISKKEDSLVLHVKNKSDFSGPFRISGYQEGIKTYDEWFTYRGEKDEIALAKKDYDLIVMNDSIGYPDFNQKNNYYKPGRLFRRKLKFGIVTDIPSQSHDHVFIFPEFEWNNYDKFQFGITLSNKTILPKKWIFKLKPQYSSGENALTGSLNTLYRIFPESGWFRQIFLSTSASYQHYNRGLAYKSFGLGSFFTFQKQARSLKDRSLYGTFQLIQREMPVDALQEELELKDYSLFNFGYRYWNPAIIHERKALVNFQFSNKFSKVFGEVYWRWKFAKNKRLMVRFFGGSFLGHDLVESDYFDFGLDRITDYTFQYPLLGRSETTGTLSQQFVLAEGGFKSNFFVRANQYMYTTNLEYPLWKMLDLYADAGIYKNKLHPTKFVYDTGVRLRVIPDFLELYLPIQSTLGFEPTLGAYHERIRFMLNLDFGKVIKYWKRGRF